MAEQIKERANIPSSPECGQWETLLVDALDGVLRPEDEAVFSNHMAICASCTALFEEARRGREWLEFLAPEPEVPAYLLDRILGDTGHGKFEPGKLVVAGVGGNVLVMPPVWQRPSFGARFSAGLRRFAEPRLMLTAAMAFFSIALTLSITGVRISSVSIADLRPSALHSILEKRIVTASTPLVRYYDHLRFVYEVEARMRELRRSTEMQQQNQQQSQPGTQGTPSGEGVTHRKDGGSQLNPKDAPQQTVNPRTPLWSGELQEARLNLPGRSRLTEFGDNSQGYPTLTQAPGPERAGWTKQSVLALPEWSSKCRA
jgi:hypothetical protein